MTLDVTQACVVPRRAETIEEVRHLLATEGAALVGGVASQSAGADLAAEILSDKLIRIGRQFEASKRHHDEETAKIESLPVDARGRKRFFTPPAERMIPHNDGFSFADFAPDYLFLWCEQPARPEGGDSFLIDAYKLSQLLAAEPETAELAQFCWDTDIDQSEPSSLEFNDAPIARRVASGRVQVRNHPYFMARVGELEATQDPLVRQWQDLLLQARDTGPTFRVEAGDMICADNYRVLHGRYEYDDFARKVHSIWGWTTDAIAVPKEVLDIAAPAVPTAVAV
jgi:hypothetical protein